MHNFTPPRRTPLALLVATLLGSGARRRKTRRPTRLRLTGSVARHRGDRHDRPAAFDGSRRRRRSARGRRRQRFPERGRHLARRRQHGLRGLAPRAGPDARQRSIRLRARPRRALLERAVERRTGAFARPHAQRDPARPLPDRDHRCPAGAEGLLARGACGLRRRQRRHPDAQHPERPGRQHRDRLGTQLRRVRFGLQLPRRPPRQRRPRRRHACVP